MIASASERAVRSVNICVNMPATIAGYSPRVPERHLEVLLANVRAFSRGEPLSNVVNKAEWF